eukprot:1659973-Prymnesium_polylepis.1
MNGLSPESAKRTCTPEPLPSAPLSCPDCQIRIRARRTWAMRSSTVSQCSAREEARHMQRLCT